MYREVKMNFEKYAIDSVLNKLPFSISFEIKSEIKNMGDLEEIRIRKNSNLVLTSNGQNYVCKKEFSSKELSEIVKSLCDNSVYAYDGTIRKGYIPCKNGVRIGVCGKCVCENGKIINVTDVSALNIRIPRYIKGISKELCDRFKKDGVYKSILVFSSPGVRKTTLLRDMAISLSSGENPVRVAIVDKHRRCCIGRQTQVGMGI